MSWIRRVFETELNNLDCSKSLKPKEKSPEEDKSEQIEKRKELYDWEPPKDKVLLDFDWQGWPIYAQKLKEILLELGFEDDGEKIYLKHDEKNDALLESYPRILTDDGMGYGVSEEYVSEVDKDTYEDNIGEKKVNVFNIFREKFVPEK